MLFDFIKKRAQEGVEQTQNLVSAAQEGRLDEALKETSAYVKDRYFRAADYMNDLSHVLLEHDYKLLRIMS